MLLKSEWVNIIFDHPLLEDVDVRRVVYQAALGEPEKIQMWIYTPQRRTKMIAGLLGKTVRFRLMDADHRFYFHHWLAEIKWLMGKELAGRQHYILTWQSPVAKLGQTNLSVVLQEVSLREAFRLILSGRLISKNPLTLQIHDLQVAREIDQLQAPLKAHQESLLIFFKRLLAFNGMSYFFDHSCRDCPLLITDSIASAGKNIDVAEYRYAEGDLLTSPFIECFKTRYSATSALFEVSGHPDRDPQFLLKEEVRLPNSFATFHAGFGERHFKETADYAKWVSEHDVGQSARSVYSGGGIVFAGQIMHAQKQILVASSWTLELDGAVKNRIKQIQTSFYAQPLELPYREAMDLNPKQYIMSGHTITENNVSVDARGHYQVTLPPYFIQNKPRSLEATRMVYPLQSDDHRQHYTLMPDAETLKLWWGSHTSQSLILGTINSTKSPHLTQQETNQNAYWQDDSANRIAFINEGAYDPTQKTGRKTAHILETPSYHPDGFSNYLRMGDAVKKDGAYSSQAAEPGILSVTEGHYHETHHGGLMALMGNMGSDQNNPIPALRQRVQLNPSFGTSHILKTVNAHLHTADITSDQVSENKTLDADTLTHTLTSPDYFLTHGQDEIRGIYINQAHRQNGRSNTIHINTHALFTAAQTRSLKQIGGQRTDQYQNKTLMLNHPLNTLQYQTLTQKVMSLHKQTTTETSNIQNYTRTHQQSMQQAGQFTKQNQSMQSMVGKSYFGDMLNLEAGSRTPLPPDSAFMSSNSW